MCNPRVRLVVGGVATCLVVVGLSACGDGGGGEVLVPERINPSLLGGCPASIPDCVERLPTPEEMWDMEQAIRSRTSCPDIQDLLLENTRSFRIVTEGEDPDGYTAWTVGDSSEFTIWVDDIYWFLPEYGTLLDDVMYHEGAHALVGSDRQHDSVWEDAFSCYSA